MVSKNNNFVSNEFEKKAVEKIDSMWTTLVPNCKHDGMERRIVEKTAEFDGFGYLLNDDPGEYGEALPDEGVIIIELPDEICAKPRAKSTTLSESPEAKRRGVHQEATKYITAEAFLGIGDCTKQLQFDDVEAEEAKATKKLEQLEFGLQYMHARHISRYGCTENPNAAGFLATFCYKYPGEPRKKPTPRKKKLDRLKRFIETLLIDSYTRGDDRFFECLELAKSKRLFLAVFTNDDLPTVTEKIESHNEKIDSHNERVGAKNYSVRNRYTIALLGLLFFAMCCFQIKQNFNLREIKHSLDELKAEINASQQKLAEDVADMILNAVNKKPTNPTTVREDENLLSNNLWQNP